MRKAGVLTSSDDARKLTAAYYASGIEAQVHEEGGTFTFWVLDDDQMEKARDLIALLTKEPENSLFFTKIPAPVKERPDPLEKRRGKNRARNIDVRSEVFGRPDFSKAPFTTFLIIISVLATALSNFPGAVGLVRSLYFSEYMGHSFPEIRVGQVWRLVTPILLHGGFFHLLFNMLWLHQLGSMVEQIEKRWFLPLLVCILAIGCNTSQYLISGPLFIGMSGVVYGLLGFVYMMSTQQMASRYFIHQSTVVFMMIWLVVCLAGIIPNVANTQHVAGVIFGSMLGFLYAKVRNR